MKTFLSEVVTHTLSKYPKIENVKLILPSKRARVFLRNEFGKQLKENVFAPAIISIEEFVEQLSSLRATTNTQLLFEFYSTYQELTPKEQQESFDSFSKWGQILLQDFNEIDRYLIPHREIFSYLSAIQETDHWSKQETELIANYLAFWRKLPQYYQQFTDRLVAKGIGYQGLIYREAVENIEYYLQANAEGPHLFVGFNALNAAEQQIIQEMLQHGNTEVFWDIDEVFFEDPKHDASLFLRGYRFGWKYFENNTFNWIANNFEKEKQLNIVGIPKNVGQAKYIGELLSKSDIANNDYSNTAVVLADETLLIPVLNSLPEELQHINITMGYPMAHSPMAIFFESFFNLHQKSTDGSYYYKNLLDLFSDPYGQILFRQDGTDTIANVIDKIQQQNILYVSLEQLISLAPEAKVVIELLFTEIPNNAPNLMIGRCLRLLLFLKEKLSKYDTDQLLSLEYTFRFHEIFNQIDSLNAEYGHIDSLKALIVIYKELLQLENLDFQGEPLEGLQLMGMLETRVLDFETVIISSVNEGILPSGKSNNSFIPFDVKKQYNLPTYKEKDAIYTYHFYRLLQRAKKVHILYNTETDSFKGGEKSRFIMQLQVEQQLKHLVKELIVSPTVETLTTTLKRMAKTPEMIERLRSLAAYGFSPSALANYIRNPMDFFYEKMLGISQPEEVEETVAANTLGTIVHDVLEKMYTPFVGRQVEEEAIKKLLLQTEELVTEMFIKVYGKGNISSGKNLIIFHVAQRYVTNFLQKELQLVQSGKVLKILELETKLKSKLEIPEIPFPIHITGKVDRVDELDGVVRVIDYKTGKATQLNLNLPSWEVITSDYNKYSKSLQVLCYAYMIQDKYHFSKPMEAGIISFKNLQSGFLKFTDKTTKTSLISNETLDNFLIELKKLIIEICDPTIPFEEKEL